MTQAITPQRACPVCSGAQAEALHHQAFALFENNPLPKEYTIVCCATCGAVYADSRATQSDYDAFYAGFSIYEAKTPSVAVEETWWDVQRHQATAQVVASILPDKEARLLDIGCANGGLLAQFAGLGYRRLSGIDPSPACAANTRRLGMLAQTGTLTSLPPNPGIYDCILLSHVLEHVYDLQRGVSQAAAMLNPGGFLYIEVPDASRYVDFVIAPFQDFNTEHINHFSLPVLDTLMSSSGLRSIQSAQKDILSAPEMPYPALYAIYQKETTQSDTTPIRRDVELKYKIEAYIHASQEILEAIDRTLADILAQNQEMILWGAGQLALKLLVETRLRTARIIAIVDSNPILQGRTLNGIRVLSPTEARRLQEPILISSMLHQPSIINMIRNTYQMNNPVYTLNNPEAA